MLRIQPDEGISLHFGAKVPGEAFRVQSVAMDFAYEQAFAEPRESDGYPRLLHDAMMRRRHPVHPDRRGGAGLADRGPLPGGVVGAGRRAALLPGRDLGAPHRRPPAGALRRRLAGARAVSADPMPSRADALAPVADVPEAFARTRGRARSPAGPGPRFSMVLSGGPTARACYERAAALPPGTVDWTMVDVYMGDERMVPPDDPDANQRLVREALVDPVGGVGSFTPMPTEGDPEACAAAYQAVLAGVLAGRRHRPGPPGHGPRRPHGLALPRRPHPGGRPDRLVVATADPNGRNPHPRLTLTCSRPSTRPAWPCSPWPARPSARPWPAAGRRGPPGGPGARRRPSAG